MNSWKNLARSGNAELQANPEREAIGTIRESGDGMGGKRVKEQVPQRRS